MKTFLNILKVQYYNKYQRTLANKRYIKSRTIFFQKILNQKKTNLIKTDKYINKKVLLTKDFLQKTLNIKKNYKENEVLMKLYKKFNYSLKLKKKYSLQMYKLTNENEHFSTYIYLGNQLLDFDKINELQKLNSILKINDITLINFKKSRNLDLIPYIKKNIIFEIKILKKYAKKFINHIS